MHPLRSSRADVSETLHHKGHFYGPAAPDPLYDGVSVELSSLSTVEPIPDGMKHLGIFEEWMIEARQRLISQGRRRVKLQARWWHSLNWFKACILLVSLSDKFSAYFLSPLPGRESRWRVFVLCRGSVFTCAFSLIWRV